VLFPLRSGGDLVLFVVMVVEWMVPVVVGMYRSAGVMLVVVVVADRSLVSFIYTMEGGSECGTVSADKN